MSIAAHVAAHGPVCRGATDETLDGVVRRIQQALRRDGAELLADGNFGRVTEAAVRAMQIRRALQPAGYVGPKTAAALDTILLSEPKPATPPMASAMQPAPHLSIMRAITGTKEYPGARSNPAILAWATYIVGEYPTLRPGVGWYKSDATAWCGLCIAYCVAKAGFRPALNPLWALNWADDWTDGVQLPAPVLGAIGVMKRSGGGHVTMYEGENAGAWFGRGGNQSDSVNVMEIPHSRPVRWMWPKGLAVPDTGRVRTSFAGAVKAASEA